MMLKRLRLALVLIIVVGVGFSSLSIMILFALGYGSDIPGIDAGNFIAELFSLVVDASLFAVLFSFVLPGLLEKRRLNAENARWAEARQEAASLITKTISDTSLFMTDWRERLTIAQDDGTTDAKPTVLQVRMSDITLAQAAFSKASIVVDEAFSIYSAAMTPELMKDMIQFKHAMAFYGYDLAGAAKECSKFLVLYSRKNTSKNRLEFQALCGAIIEDGDEAMTNIVDVEKYNNGRAYPETQDVEELAYRLNMTCDIVRKLEQAFDDSRLKNVTKLFHVWDFGGFGFDDPFLNPFEDPSMRIMLHFDEEQPAWVASR